MLAVGAAALALVLTPERESPQAAEPAPPVSWQGLVGDGPRAPVHIGQQMIVVLKAPSLAQRVEEHGGVAANSELRASLPDATAAPLPLCTDNAAMIASAARFIEAVPYPRYLELDAYASR